MFDESDIVLRYTSKEAIADRYCSTLTRYPRKAHVQVCDDEPSQQKDTWTVTISDWQLQAMDRTIMKVLFENEKYCCPEDRGKKPDPESDLQQSSS
jgi:hypothetical protein